MPFQIHANVIRRLRSTRVYRETHVCIGNKENNDRAETDILVLSYKTVNYGSLKKICYQSICDNWTKVNFSQFLDT